MKSFDGIIRHTDPFVADTASLVQMFTEQYEAGELTNEEYRQLVHDLVDAKRINDITNDVQRRVEISKAFQQLYMIAGVIGKFI